MKRFALTLILFLAGSASYAQGRATDTEAAFNANSAVRSASESSGLNGFSSEVSSSAPSAAADSSEQDFAHETLKKGAWETGIIGGGGDGLGKSDNTQFMYAGGRVGVVLTGEHLPGWLRGDFEWAADLMPIFTVLSPDSAVYGGSFKPVIWQWNFTSKKKVVPYFAAAGGIIFTHQNVPPGDTSNVNFSPQASFGAHVFTKRRQALLFEMSIVHISNASLGTHNPGYNGSIFFTIGYSWFHGGH